MLKEYCST